MGVIHDTATLADNRGTVIRLRYLSSTKQQTGAPSESAQPMWFIQKLSADSSKTVESSLNLEVQVFGILVCGSCTEYSRDLTNFSSGISYVVMKHEYTALIICFPKD